MKRISNSNGKVTFTNQESTKSLLHEYWRKSGPPIRCPENRPLPVLPSPRPRGLFPDREMDPRPARSCELGLFGTCHPQLCLSALPLSFAALPLLLKSLGISHQASPLESPGANLASSRRGGVGAPAKSFGFKCATSDQKMLGLLQRALFCVHSLHFALEGVAKRILSQLIHIDDFCGDSERAVACLQDTGWFEGRPIWNSSGFRERPRNSENPPTDRATKSHRAAPATKPGVPGNPPTRGVVALPL